MDNMHNKKLKPFNKFNIDNNHNRFILNFKPILTINKLIIINSYKMKMD
jgi:hypothetical protein